MVRRRVIVVSILIMGCFAILAVRLFFIQIVHHQMYSQRSRNQSFQREKIRAKRGRILDRKGRVLAQTMYTSTMINGTGRKNEGTIRRPALQSGAYTVSRIYPFGEFAGPVLGFVGKDDNGLSGAEYAFENHLKGEDGWFMLQRFGSVRRYNRVGTPEKSAVDGSDVYLTIDYQLQAIVEKVLKQTILSLKAKAGMCIVMDPHTGNVIAMANVPQFNPNCWNISSSYERQNRCISFSYEPGSTFKVLTAASALEENIKDENDLIDGNQGRFQIGDQVIRDHKAYGMLTFNQALTYSSNVCFAQVATELGNKRLFRYAKDFGLGTQAGIALPGEEAGVVHPLEKWSKRTGVTMAIGHEVSVTLLQMVTAFCVVANGGVLLEPNIYSMIVNARGEKLKNQVTRARRRVISEKTASRLRQMMRGVVEEGTAKRSNIPGLTIAGKTGTAQKFDREKRAYSHTKFWASFIGFVPAENPALVCGIVIDEPANGEEGGVAAAPAFREIIHEMITYPDLEYAEKILHQSDSASARILTSSAVVDTPSGMRGKKVPDLCNMPIGKARSRIAALKAECEIVGDGRWVGFQTPAMGTTIARETKIILYTVENDSVHTGSVKTASSVSMPDCIGKDLRDAVNMLYIKGLVPHIRGTGIVREQLPPSGTRLFKSRKCVLLCSRG